MLELRGWSFAMRCDAVLETMVVGDKSRLEHHLAGVAEDRSLSEMVLCGS